LVLEELQVVIMEDLRVVDVSPASTTEYSPKGAETPVQTASTRGNTTRICKQCGGRHLPSECSKVGTVIIPMGYCCPTAAFVKQCGLRFTAMPLDWSKTTLPMWQHIFADGCAMLADSTQIIHNEKGRPFHKIYREPQFPRACCLEHGYDAPSWARRCNRFKQLLLNGHASRLGIHIDYENTTTQLAKSDSQSCSPCSLDVIVSQAAELMRTADDLGMYSFHLVAVFMISQESSSADATRIQIEPFARKTSDGYGQCDAFVDVESLDEQVDEHCAMTNTRVQASDLRGCFARVCPHERATVVRYIVPHTIRNAKGYPLLGNCSALIHEDSARLHAILSMLYPTFFLDKL